MPGRDRSKRGAPRPDQREQARAGTEAQSRNREQLDRRNAIADAVDEGRESELDDVDGETILPKRRTNGNAHTTRARSAEDEAEEAAAREEQEAETERRRLERAAEEGGEEGARARSDRRPVDDEDDEEEDDEGGGRQRQAAGDDDEEGEAGESRLTNGVRYYRCIVNGKEKWLTLSQLRTTAQKVESADEYLQNAAASVRSAAQLGLSGEDGTAEDEEDDTEAVLNKALLGDQEAVKQLAQRLKAKPSRVTPDVLQAVDERMTFRQAVDWFEDEYEEELADPRLKAMIVQEDARLAQENPQMGYKTRLKKAGTAIRKWKAELTGEGEGEEARERPTRRGSDSDSASSKETRKRTLGSVPRAGGRQNERGDEGDEESVGTVIDSMAKARHQTRSIKHGRP